jgi:uncharacterized cupredoxin-like copper-binding protein
MSRTRVVLVATAAALVLTVAVPLATARPQAARKPTTTVVVVMMKDFKFVFPKTRVHAGKVAFVLVNKGKVAHDLHIAGKTSAKVKPGKRGSLTVTLKKGKYPYKCTVPGHAALGMKGTLTVA